MPWIRFALPERAALLEALDPLIRRLPPRYAMRLWAILKWAVWHRRRRLWGPIIAEHLEQWGRKDSVDTVLAGSATQWAVKEFVVAYSGTPHMDTLAVRPAGVECLASAVAAGRGVILVTVHAHLNFLIPWLLLKENLPVGGVANRDGILSTRKGRRNWAMGERLLGSRMVIVRQTQIREAYRLLANGGVLVIAQDLGEGGDHVTFLGRQHHWPLGALRLAEKTGAAVIPGIVDYSDGACDLVIRPPLKLHGGIADRQTLASALEELVRAYPHTFDWFYALPPHSAQ